MVKVSHITLPDGMVLDTSDYVIFGDKLNASATFAVGDIVSYDGNYYICTAVTTNAFFDASAWSQLTVVEATATQCTAGTYYLYNSRLYLCNTNRAYFDPNNSTDFTSYTYTTATPATSCYAGSAYYVSGSAAVNYICNSAATFDPSDTTHFTQVTAASATSGTSCTANRYYYKSGDNSHIYKCITAAGFDTADTTHFEPHEVLTVVNGGTVTAGNWYYCATATSYIYYCNTSGTFTTSGYSSTCSRYSRSSATEGTACTVGNYYYNGAYLYHCTADTKFNTTYYSQYFTRYSRSIASTGTACTVGSYYYNSNKYYKCLTDGPFKPTDTSAFEQLTTATASVTTGTAGNYYYYNLALYCCDSTGAVFAPNSSSYDEVVAVPFVQDTSSEIATITIHPPTGTYSWSIPAAKIVDMYTKRPEAEFIFIVLVNGEPVICRESKRDGATRYYYADFNRIARNSTNDKVFEVGGTVSFSVDCSTGAVTNRGTSSISYVSNYSANEISISGGGGGGETVYDFEYDFLGLVVALDNSGADMDGTSIPWIRSDGTRKTPITVRADDMLWIDSYGVAVAQVNAPQNFFTDVNTDPYLGGVFIAMTPNGTAPVYGRWQLEWHSENQNWSVKLYPTTSSSTINLEMNSVISII